MANLGDPTGREQSGYRPVLVVSGAYYNSSISSLLLVMPLTSKGRGWLSHVAVTGENSGLDRPSWVMVEQLRAIDRSKLTKFVGHVDEVCLEHVERINKMHFGYAAGR